MASAIRRLDRSKHVRICVYSDPGVGKTRLAGTSPGRVLIIRPPFEHTDSILPADRPRVREWVVNDWQEMNEDVLDYLRRKGDKWDWVWLDSISLWQDAGLDDLWHTIITENPRRKRYGLDQGDIGINMSRLARWVRFAVGPDKFNFGVTAHTAELRPSDDPKVDEKLMPYVQGKNMSPKICGYMNVVAFLDLTAKGARILRTSANSRYYAKDQFDALPKGKLLKPTMPKVMELIEKSRPTTQQGR